MQLLPNPPASVTLLDNAAGAGCVSTTLVQSLQKAGKSLDGVQIVAGDTAPVILELLSQRVAHHGWGKVINVKNIDARVVKTRFHVHEMIPTNMSVNAEHLLAE